MTSEMVLQAGTDGDESRIQCTLARLQDMHVQVSMTSGFNWVFPTEQCTLAVEFTARNSFRYRAFDAPPCNTRRPLRRLCSKSDGDRKRHQGLYRRV